MRKRAVSPPLHLGQAHTLELLVHDEDHQGDYDEVYDLGDEIAVEKYRRLP